MGTAFSGTNIMVDRSGLTSFYNNQFYITITSNVTSELIITTLTPFVSNYNINITNLAYTSVSLGDPALAVHTYSIISNGTTPSVADPSYISVLANIKIKN